MLKILLKIKSIFEHSDPRYLLNTLYVDDFCIWIQQVDEKKIIDLAEKVKKIEISKADLGLELEELEAAAL